MICPTLVTPLLVDMVQILGVPYFTLLEAVLTTLPKGKFFTLLVVEDRLLEVMVSPLLAGVL